MTEGFAIQPPIHGTFQKRPGYAIAVCGSQALFVPDRGGEMEGVHFDFFVADKSAVVGAIGDIAAEMIRKVALSPAILRPSMKSVASCRPGR